MQILLKENGGEQILLYNELSKLILERSRHRPQLPSSEMSANEIVDVAYVEAAIQAQYAVGLRH